MDEDRAAVEARIRGACAAADFKLAATTGLEAYGGEVLGYLVAVTRDEAAAGEVFSMFGEDLWRGLPGFRWECTFRTWSYGLARHALARFRRDPFRKRATPLDDAATSAVIERLRSQTATYLRTETKEKIARLRAELDPDDQTLLILRINRGLGWREIARVFAEGADDGAQLERQSAALRKRFERLKADLKQRARAG